MSCSFSNQTTDGWMDECMFPRAAQICSFMAAANMISSVFLTIKKIAHQTKNNNNILFFLLFCSRRLVYSSLNRSDDSICWIKFIVFEMYMWFIMTTDSVSKISNKYINILSWNILNSTTSWNAKAFFFVVKKEKRELDQKY